MCPGFETQWPWWWKHLIFRASATDFSDEPQVYSSLGEANPSEANSDVSTRSPPQHQLHQLQWVLLFGNFLPFLHGCLDRLCSGCNSCREINPTPPALSSLQDQPRFPVYVRSWSKKIFKAPCSLSQCHELISQHNKSSSGLEDPKVILQVKNSSFDVRIGCSYVSSGTWPLSAAPDIFLQVSQSSACVRRDLKLKPMIQCYWSYPVGMRQVSAPTLYLHWESLQSQWSQRIL